MSPLKALAEKEPEGPFIHDVPDPDPGPGPVRTNLASGGHGAAIFVLNAIFKNTGPMLYIPIQECGERHFFLVTSARVQVKKQLLRYCRRLKEEPAGKVEEGCTVSIGTVRVRELRVRLGMKDGGERVGR